MDNLTFISNMTNSLIWPCLIFLSLYILRTPISHLIPRITRVKFKELEADFQGLSVSDQSLLFLDGVGRKFQWTFYEKARSGERALGQAFLIIVKDLLNVERDEVIKKLKLWLVSNNGNLIWFASEIIGYYKIGELKGDLLRVMPNDFNIDLEEFQLNTLWAYARITSFDDLIDVLQSTTSKTNQKWLLFVFDQMPDSSDFSFKRRVSELDKFIQKDLIDEEIAVFVKEILDRLTMSVERIENQVT